MSQFISKIRRSLWSERRHFDYHEKQRYQAEIELSRARFFLLMHFN